MSRKKSKSKNSILNKDKFPQNIFNYSKKTSKFVKLSIVAILAMIVGGIIIFFILQNKEPSLQQKLYKEHLEKQHQFKKEQEFKDIQRKQAFEEKTQAMEIEYANEEPTAESPISIKEEKSVFNFLKDSDKYKNEELPKIKQKESLAKTTIKKKETIKERKTDLIKDTPPKIIKELPLQVQPKTIRPIPKLAIIIDDVTFSSQVEKINEIPYPVTMAFLPPTSKHKNSAQINKNLQTYMIHLPLEAKYRQYEEENTLHIEDDISIIDQRIKKLKKLFPKAKYINNHTGSKFTANRTAMDKLLKILKKYNYIFVDSRTTSKTVTKQYANKHKIRYLNRNIFLDNKKEKRYIQKQLQKAVKIAKRDGFAIAIGHPHNITLKTLAKSKYLLKGLDIILINKL